jgi:polysaccharide export outer membrane protein
MRTPQPWTLDLSKLIALLILTGMLAAQQFARNPNHGSVDRKENADTLPRSLAAADPKYVIGPDDILSVNVWKEAEVSAVVPVRPDGKISLPLLNDVQAAGLTPLQLSLNITGQLTKYLNQPRVTVLVTTINSRRVYVLGEVSRSGAYNLLPNMTVLQLLSMAGNFTQFADTKNIYVLRNKEGKEEKHPFNYRAVVKGQASAENIPLEPGDTVVVP